MGILMRYILRLLEGIKLLTSFTSLLIGITYVVTPLIHVLIPESPRNPSEAVFSSSIMTLLTPSILTTLIPIILGGLFIFTSILVSVRSKVGIKIGILLTVFAIFYLPIYVPRLMLPYGAVNLSYIVIYGLMTLLISTIISSAICDK